MATMTRRSAAVSVQMGSTPCSHACSRPSPTADTRTSACWHIRRSSVTKFLHRPQFLEWLRPFDWPIHRSCRPRCATRSTFSQAICRICATSNRVWRTSSACRRSRPTSRSNPPRPVRIVGGYAPDNNDGVEVARVCNFNRGRHQIAHGGARGHLKRRRPHHRRRHPARRLRHGSQRARTAPCAPRRPPTKVGPMAST